MNILFKKYQFPSKEFFDSLLINTEVSPYSTITELGILVEDFYSVDALWYETPPDSWGVYEIKDVEGNGSHTYLGWDFTN